MYDKILQTLNKIEEYSKNTSIDDLEYIQKNINISYSQGFLNFNEFLNLTENIKKLVEILK